MQDPELREMLGGLQATLAGINGRLDRMEARLNNMASIQGPQGIQGIQGIPGEPQFNPHIHCWQKNPKFRLDNKSAERYIMNSIGAALMGAIVAVLKLAGLI